MNEIYQRFIDLCEKKGEKPAVVCRKAGVSASLPTDMKMGRKKGMSLVTAGKLSAYLGISVDEILGVGSGATQAGNDTAPAQPAFIQSYNLLDQIDQAKVEAYIAGLLAQPKYNG